MTTKAVAIETRSREATPLTK